ncbi:substrate-binding domain-containing protein [Mycobacterium cookii]|uniref:Substrate-binding domain-containing protein n=1 Tax=Nocardioides furvisabuli TaxID=375542 RepID=A0ABP5J6L2_9ACTN|nr:substrate-binding domain-containing protein [Nocardioides furvisabuli]
MRLTTHHVLASAAAATAAVLTLTACAPSASDDGGEAGAGGGSIEVGVITSETGPLAAYGTQFLSGFEAGLDYATDGTGEVAGVTIEIRNGDDTGDPDKAVQLAKEYVGDGVKILTGTVSSGISLSLAEQAAQNKVLYISGAAAADAITGLNAYTFRSGRQSMQDVATAGTFLEDIDGQKVVVYAQDNAFGQGNSAAVEALLGAEGATVEPLLVGEDIKEFTSFSQQLKDADPDLVFVAWAGETTGSMWQSLEQQGVFDVAPVVTGLGDVATYGAYGPVAERISFLSHYFGTAPDNDVNAAMVEAVEGAGGTVDLFTPDGFTAAQMIVRAIEEGDGDVEAMVEALEGYTFAAPKGEVTVREGDHALLQEMYQARLVADGDSFTPELVETVAADQVAPPEAG